MAEMFSNRAESVLASGIAAGATSITVTAGHGARFPSTGDFSILLQAAADATVYELVQATARSTDTITITATANAWIAGDKVVHVLDKRAMEAIRDKVIQTADIANDAVTYAKIQNVSAASRILGRGQGAGAGDTQELTLGTGLSLAGTVLSTSVGDLLDYQFVRKTADESVTSSTVLQNDDHLLQAIGANQTWEFEGVIYFGTSGSDVVDMEVAFTVPSGATLLWAVTSLVIGQTGSAGDALMVARNASGQSIAIGSSGQAPFNIMTFRGLVLNGGTAGNLQFQWAQDTSSATPLIVSTNSYLLAKRFA